MRKKLLVPIIAGLPLFIMCYHGEEQSGLQGITELTRTCSQDSVRNLMRGCAHIFLRSHSLYHEGYALCIPTDQTEERYYNVIIAAIPIKDKEDEEWKYIFKINKDSVMDDTLFHSLEEDSLLFESLYGCKARDIIKLIEFCRQYTIVEVHLCDRNTISMETPEFHLYNSSDCDRVHYTHLSGNWYYEKRK